MTAVGALAEIDSAGHSVIAIDARLVEFDSLLRKSVTAGRMTLADAEAILLRATAIQSIIVETTTETRRRPWEVATSLNQSDVFDALGYAAAETHDAEFWTSDLRFANAARAQGLSRFRYIA